jgi:hypothetical protein
MSAISSNLRKHAARIKSECGWMAGGVPDIYHDLILGADHIDHLDKYVPAFMEGYRLGGVAEKARQSSQEASTDTKTAPDLSRHGQHD